MPFSGKQNRQPVPIGIDPTDFDQATSSYTNLIDHCDDITNNEEHWSTPSTLRRKLVPGLPVPVTHGVQFSVRSDERPVKLQHTPCRKIIMAVVLAILPAPFFVHGGFAWYLHGKYVDEWDYIFHEQLFDFGKKVFRDLDESGADKLTWIQFATALPYVFSLIVGRALQ